MFKGVSSDNAELNWLDLLLIFILVKSLFSLDSLHDFPINIPRCYKDSYPNNYFPRCAGLFGILCL